MTHEYAYCSDKITNLSKALLNVQRNLLPALKDGTNPFHKSKYATLNSVMESCRNTLIENGVLLTQYPVPVDGENLGLVTKLTHCETGEWQASLAKVPLAKNDAQAFGSAITYCRRYALSAMLGIVTEDDDGNAASNLAAARTNSRSYNKKPGNEIIPLSKIMNDIGLAELLPSYRKYLEATYNCLPEKLNDNQYQEQKELLEGLKNDPIQMRNFMRTLHTYKTN